MRSTLKYLFIVCAAFLMLNGSLTAQTNNKVNGNFLNVPFKKFVTEIEASASYHFFYDASSLDTFLVNATANNSSLPDLLKQVFKTTAFHFAIDEEGHVFI